MNQLIIDEQENKPTFQIADLVWAKILGWPWWPGRIAKIPSGKCREYKIQFFADTSHAFLPQEKLVSYLQGRHRYSTPKRHYRNFTKALGLADKLLQSIVKRSDDVQSQTAQREKIPVQQNQIINSIQQVQLSPINKIENKQQQIEVQSQGLHESQSIRKPRKTLRMRKYHSSSNKLSVEQLQTEVDSLLKKYKLESITDQKPRRQQNRIMKKTKIILKNIPEQISRVQIEMKMARKINKCLSLKDINFTERNQIVRSLINSYFKCRQNQDLKVKGIHRALFQWIRVHDAETIQKDYKHWPLELDSSTLNIT